MEASYRQSYAAYREMLEAGIAREVARAVLPVGLFSTMYATCNARSLMHFLSLRTKNEQSKMPSFPQREIEMVGEKMEAAWSALISRTRPSSRPDGSRPSQGRQDACLGTRWQGRVQAAEVPSVLVVKGEPALRGTSCTAVFLRTMLRRVSPDSV